ncbi:MAG: hypothetical protein NC348_12660 [Clostridium sp.]|nr:hypothetical protein [Clostridium sp.]
MVLYGAGETDGRQRLKIRLVIILFCLFCADRFNVLFVQAEIRYADESENIVLISNQQEFYEAMGYQIREHKNTVYYDTYENAVGVDLQEAFDGYDYHHDKENLLNSGIYLCRYIKGGQMLSRYGHFSEGCNCRHEVTFEYKYGKKEMDEYFAAMREVAARIKGKSDFESVKAVHDYLIKNFDYDEHHENYLDYEGYLNGTMVCQGYCMAAFFLLAEMDIPVRIVTGSAEDYETDANHAWNVVNVDGKWYNMDVTWDDKGGWRPPDYTYFLKSDADFYRHTREGRYDYDKDMAIVSYPMRNRTGTLLWTVFMIALLSFIVFLRLREK